MIGGGEAGHPSDGRKKPSAEENAYGGRTQKVEAALNRERRLLFLLFAEHAQHTDDEGHEDSG
jgi:hypothetical protein